MTRIAYVLNRFPVLSETFVGQEIRAMEAIGHEISIIALNRPEGNYQPEDAVLAERTHYVPSISPEDAAALLRRYRFRQHRIRAYMRLQTAEPRESFLLNALQMAEIIRKQRCTHVHAHFAWISAARAIAAARLLKLPVSFTCHGSDVYVQPWDLDIKCRYANAVIGVAPTITADIKKVAGKTPCHTIHCGVDTERFKPRAEKHDRWLFVGRLIECKGIDDLVNAWALLPPDRRPPLDIVGDGAMSTTLQAIVGASSLGDCITFLGAQPATWITEHAPSYRALVAPFKKGSDGSRDTAPMVLKEAMAMALPIITTRFIDIPQLVGEECAILCPPSSPHAIAAAVLQMQALPESTLRTMGNAGRARVNQLFSVHSQVAQLSQLFRAY